VIDVLDECDNNSDMATILQLFAQAKALSTVQLRVLVISRPEISISHGFNDMTEEAYRAFGLHDIEKSVVKPDIFIFIKYTE
jgi:hypothetical protein